jgi:hypothetical protein
MKAIVFALLVTVIGVPTAILHAQQTDQTSCVAGCVRQDAVCQERAKADLSACLAEATNHAQRLACAAALKVAADACRSAEESCVAACE